MLTGSKEESFHYSQISPMLLTGEFGDVLYTYIALHQTAILCFYVETKPTTPARRAMFCISNYTIPLCDLQGIFCTETRKRSDDSRLDTGGDKEARTPDLGSAIAALYQLSYIPVNKAHDIILW